MLAIINTISKESLFSFWLPVVGNQKTFNLNSGCSSYDGDNTLSFNIIDISSRNKLIFFLFDSDW